MNEEIKKLIDTNKVPKELIPLDVYFSDTVLDKKEKQNINQDYSEIFIEKYNFKTSLISVLMKPLSKMFDPEKIIR